MSPEQSVAVATLQAADPAESASPIPRQEAPTCTNCGASVQGSYCGRCGQRLEHEIHSVWHFTREATEDLTHADSRLWGTMNALIFKPGFLTREFLAGRRARYLPPLRLYLVLSVLFFLIIGSGHHNTKAVWLKTDQGGTQSYALTSPEDVRGDFAAKPGETPEQRADRVCKADYDGPARGLLQPFITKACRTTVLRLLPAAIEAWLTAIVWLYLLYYLFVSMRRVYVQGRFRTSLKFVALAFTYFIGAVVTLLLTVSYSVYAL